MNRPSPAVLFVLAVAAAVPFLDFDGEASGRAALTASTRAPAIVTIVGTISGLLADGQVMVNDGHTDYTVGMSATTKILNLRGDEVTHDFIRVGAQIEAWGTLVGSRLVDPTIRVPTVLDKP